MNTGQTFVLRQRYAVRKRAVVARYVKGATRCAWGALAACARGEVTRGVPSPPRYATSRPPPAAGARAAAALENRRRGGLRAHARTPRSMAATSPHYAPARAFARPRGATQPAPDTPVPEPYSATMKTSPVPVCSTNTLTIMQYASYHTYQNSFNAS